VIASAFYIDVVWIGKPYFYLMPLAIILFMMRMAWGVWDRNDLLVLILSVAVLIALIPKAIMSSDPLSHLYIFNILILPVIYVCAKRLIPRDIISLLKLSYVLTFVIFLVELFYRFMNPVVAGKIVDAELISFENFYMYKMSSLMYTNSNGVGMHAAFMLATLLSIMLITKEASKKNIDISGRVYFRRLTSFSLCCVMLFFSFGSLSRASIFICFTLIALYFFLSSKSLQKLSILAFPFFAIISTSSVFIILSSNGLNVSDGSFLTKFEIFNNLVYYFGAAPAINIIFGNVLDLPYLIFDGFEGYVGHTHYFDILFTFGFFLAPLYVVLLFLPMLWYKKASLLFVGCFILIGMSNIRIFAHYLFLYLGLVMAFFDSFKRAVSENDKDFIQALKSKNP
jgi:hypothetical protein